MSKSKTLIAYHANCTDGFTAAYVTHRALVTLYEVQEEDITLLPVTYNRLNPLHEKLTEKFDTLFVVAFSLNPTVLANLNTAYPDMVITVIDHHKSAAEMYGDSDSCNGASIWRL